MLLTESEQLKHIFICSTSRKQEDILYAHASICQHGLLMTKRIAASGNEIGSATEAIVTIVYVQYQHLQAVFWS